MSDLPIIGVAVRYGDIVICLPRPKRHCDCINYGFRELGLKPPIGGPACNQGFYLGDGTYLDRGEAFEHVKRIGQELRNPDARVYLFSEDLW